MSAVIYEILQTLGKKQILGIAHDFWAFGFIQLGQVEFKLSFPKGNAFSWHFLEGLAWRLCAAPRGCVITPIKGVSLVVAYKPLWKGPCIGVVWNHQRVVCKPLWKGACMEVACNFQGLHANPPKRCLYGGYIQTIWKRLAWGLCAATRGCMPTLMKRGLHEDFMEPSVEVYWMGLGANSCGRWVSMVIPQNPL